MFTKRRSSRGMMDRAHDAVLNSSDNSEKIQKLRVAEKYAAEEGDFYLANEYREAVRNLTASSGDQKGTEKRRVRKISSLNPHDRLLLSGVLRQFQLKAEGVVDREGREYLAKNFLLEHYPRLDGIDSLAEVLAHETQTS